MVLVRDLSDELYGLRAFICLPAGHSGHSWTEYVGYVFLFEEQPRERRTHITVLFQHSNYLTNPGASQFAYLGQSGSDKLGWSLVSINRAPLIFLAVPLSSNMYVCVAVMPGKA